MALEASIVEILHKDSHCTYKHEGVVSVHEEGSYTVLVRANGVVYKFPTRWIWRLKCYRDPKIYEQATSPLIIERVK